MLALDPALLSDEVYLASYPALAHFIAEHPEIRHNPSFYLAGFAPRPRTLDESSPAGSRFLESAPIPLRAEQGMSSGPVVRAMWSIQIGVVVAAGALGLILVSGRFDRETAQGFFGLGVIALCIGGGFIASAVISILLSRRLGLWQGPGASRPDPHDDAGLTR